MEKKILILGSEGYLGSILVPFLIKNSKGYQLQGIDTCFFGKNNKSKNFSIKKKCISEIKFSEIKDINIIIDLANISNDPSSELSPNFTKNNNYIFKKKIISKLNKSKKLERYIYVSSCSVFGFNKNFVSESSKKNPLSLYAKYCLETEKYLIKNLKKKFSIIRLGTLYGWSPRMRYDIAINKILRDAFFSKRVEINGGKQFRFFSYNKLAVDIIYKLINSNHYNNIFNIGNINLNLNQLIKTISKNISYKKFQIISDQFNIDSRSYKVSNLKMKKFFPNIMRKYKVENTIKETFNLIKKDKEPFSYKKVTLNIYKQMFKKK